MKTLLFNADSGDLNQQQRDAIRELVPDMHLLITEDKAQIEAAIDDIEIAARSFPRDLLPRAHSLRWLQQWGAGADWLMRYPEAAELDFVLTNASGVHSIQITEHIFAFLLAFARNMHQAMRAQIKGEWARYSRAQVFELADKTMLLIGVGAIGARTARIASALNMHVLGVRRDPGKMIPGVEAMHGPDKLLDLLPRADFVVLTVPLTDETKGLIGEAELRAMKKTAYIVNIGRGGTIQENVLIRALQERWIAGAGLDVFETEPLPENSLLWSMDNVIITAHYSGLTPKYDQRAMDIFLDNLRRYKAGKPLNNVVDKKLGY